MTEKGCCGLPTLAMMAPAMPRPRRAGTFCALAFCHAASSTFDGRPPSMMTILPLRSSPFRSSRFNSSEVTP
jgi:hypothetical protein